MPTVCLKRIFSTMLFLIPLILMSQSQKYGDFDHFMDIGSPAIPGSASFSTQDQTYHLGGSGANIWFDHDSFSFLWKKMSGDFVIEARVEFVGQGHEPHRKTGFMIRTSEAPDAKMVAATLHGDGLTALQWRPDKGQNVEELQFETVAPEMLKIEKKGNTYSMSVAKLGEPYREIQKLENIDLGDEIMVGLYICSHNNDFFEEVVFDAVKIIE